MSTVTIPSTPPAPVSFEFTYNDLTAMNISPFTGQQQVQRWNIGPSMMKCSFRMKPADAGPWKTFLTNLQGSTNTFSFTSAFGTAYPEVGTKVWRLKSGMRAVSVSRDRVYEISFDLIEAL